MTVMTTGKMYGMNYQITDDALSMLQCPWSVSTETVCNLTRGFIRKRSPGCAHHVDKCKKWSSPKLDIYKVYSMFCVCVSTVCVGGDGVF